jgi:hypothetical protein
MGHTLSVWKVLEDFLVELRKKDIQISAQVLEDLRAARSMIDLSSFNEGAHMEAIAKAEVYTANVEAYLISQAQAVFEPHVVDEWFKRLKEANLQVDEAESCEVSDDNFVVGVPRNQKWIRIEPDNKLPEEYVLKSAEKWNLTVNKQTDGRLIVYGQLNDIKAFVKQITTVFH